MLLHLQFGWVYTKQTTNLIKHPVQMYGLFHSVVFQFPLGPCDYLLVGSFCEELMVTDPSFVQHDSSTAAQAGFPIMSAAAVLCCLVLQ